MSDLTERTEPPIAGSSPTVVRKPKISLWLLRITVGLHLVVACSQPVSIGEYLTGGYDWLAWHSILGSMMVVATMLMGAAAIAYTIFGGRIWVVPALVVLFLAEGLQIGMGHSRALAIHVPLGVFIVTAALMLFVWVWMPSAKRGRARSASTTKNSRSKGASR